MNQFKNIFYLTALAVFWNQGHSQLLGLPEGAICGSSGHVCKRLRECPIIGNPRESRPLLCSFVGREPIVCCPPSKAQEMCFLYDRMACNAVAIARRRRNIKEYITSKDSDSTEEVVSSGEKHTDHTTTEGTNLSFENSTVKQSSSHITYEGNGTDRNTKDTNLTDYEDGATKMLMLGFQNSLDNELAQTKVVGGTVVRPRELPYMALIGFGPDKEWSCGASIISENFVMSAAHCARNPILGPAMWVRVGELDLSRSDSPHIDIRITQSYIHPEYKDPAVYNDIALFRLASRLQFNAWIQPLCLQVAPEILALRGVASGWGRTDFVGDTSERLLKVDLTLVSAAECRTQIGRAGRFLPQGVDLDTMICAGEKLGGKDTCTGDSGGPLVIQGRGQCIRTQIGVVSFGRQCAMPDTPGIYTKVSSFISWIEPIVWPS